MAAWHLRLATGRLIKFQRPAVMAAVNVSPNSFYAPTPNLDDALALVADNVAAGADFIDVGGEATSPLVDVVKDAPSVQQEIDRVLPVVEAIKQRFDVLVSVDTSQPSVMRAAIDVGADMINEQRALRDDAARQMVAELQVPVCLMHFPYPQREPGSSTPAELLAQVIDDLSVSVAAAEAAGIARDRLIIDPGFGQGNFGKNCQENCYLLAHLSALQALNLPILVGWSRKSMIGDILNGAPTSERLYGSVSAAVIAAMSGAAIIRVHDVRATVDALKVLTAVEDAAIV